jgi:hypothetical protein
MPIDVKKIINFLRRYGVGRLFEESLVFVVTICLKIRIMADDYG